MTFFTSTEPIFRSKQEALDVQDRQGLINLQLNLPSKLRLDFSYTRIDQAFILWGVIAALIFITAQFSLISWTTQAIIASILTLFGSGAMIALTYFWVKVERLQSVLYYWVILMVIGIMITDLALFCLWGYVLMYLCHIWLGLSAIGYFYTGWVMKSRALTLAGFIHLFGIAILPYVMGWQFLTTGIILTFNLIVYAQTQWDMRPPIEDYALLTLEQKQFNQHQYKLRQMSASNS